MANNDFDAFFDLGDDFFDDDLDRDFEEDSDFDDFDLESDLPFGGSKSDAPKSKTSGIPALRGIEQARAELMKLRQEWETQYPEITSTLLRAYIVRMLAQFRDPSIMDYVRPLLQHVHEEVRIEAVRTLAKLGDRAMIPRLFEQLEAEDIDEAQETLRTLLAFEDSNMIPDLLRYIGREAGVSSELLKPIFAKFGAWADVRTVEILREFAERRVVLKSTGADTAAEAALMEAARQWLQRLFAAAGALKWVETADLIPVEDVKPDIASEVNPAPTPPTSQPLSPAATSVEWNALVTFQSGDDKSSSDYSLDSWISELPPKPVPTQEELDNWVSSLSLPPAALTESLFTLPDKNLPRDPFGVRRFSGNSNIGDLVRDGINAVKSGRKDEAKAFFLKAVDLDQYNEQAWLWLSGVMDGPDDQIICLENVLAINPSNERARKGLAYLQNLKPTELLLPRAVEPLVDNPFSGIDLDDDWTGDTSGVSEPESPPYDYAAEITKLHGHPIREHPVFQQIVLLGKFALPLLDNDPRVDEAEALLEPAEFMASDAKIALLVLMDTLKDHGIDTTTVMSFRLRDELPEVRFAAAVLLNARGWKPPVNARSRLSRNVTQAEFEKALGQRREK